MSAPHKLLQLQPGAAVLYRDRLHRITHIIDLNEVLVEDDETRQVSHAKVGDFAPAVVAPSGGAWPDLVSAPDDARKEATKRFEIIRPLLDMPYRSRQDVVARAKEFEHHETTLYDWIRRYEATGLVTSLFSRSRSDKSTTKLSAEVETIIQAVVESDYLTKQRKSQQKVCDEIRRRCVNAGINPPHNNTVRNRLKALADEYVMACMCRCFSCRRRRSRTRAGFTTPFLSYCSHLTSRTTGWTESNSKSLSC